MAEDIIYQTKFAELLGFFSYCPTMAWYSRHDYLIGNLLDPLAKRCSSHLKVLAQASKAQKFVGTRNKFPNLQWLNRNQLA